MRPLEKEQTETAGESVRTPAFLYHLDIVRRSADRVLETSRRAGAHVLYSVKSCSNPPVISQLGKFVEGFACSSPFEVQLVRNLAPDDKMVTYVSPGLSEQVLPALQDGCDHITFNSLSSWERLRASVGERAECGIRVNPGHSFLDDPRYDPCHPHSKLGVPLAAARDYFSQTRGADALSGIHVHSNCDSRDFRQLLKVATDLMEQVPGLLKQIRWVNLGGGYLFQDGQHKEALVSAVEALKADFGVEVFLEPGATFVRSGGFLISSVIDLFRSGGKEVAILDTTVNHLPEVFEYQRPPQVLTGADTGEHCYLLAGSSCLAGDLFGEHRFDEPLRIGSRVVFREVGAYSLVKAHMFNGINLPTIYTLSESGELVMTKRFTYEDFASRCGVDTAVAI